MWDSLFYLLIKILVCIGIIYIGQQLWNYVKTSQGSPKQKSRLSCEVKKYQQMMEELTTQQSTTKQVNDKDIHQDLANFMMEETTKLMQK